MVETLEHRVIRSKRSLQDVKLELKEEQDNDMQMPPIALITPIKSVSDRSAGKAELTPQQKSPLASGALFPEQHHIPRPPRRFYCQPTSLPRFLYGVSPKITCNGRQQ